MKFGYTYEPFKLNTKPHHVLQQIYENWWILNSADLEKTAQI